MSLPAIALNTVLIKKRLALSKHSFSHSHTHMQAEFQLFTPEAFSPTTLEEKGPPHSISNILLFYEKPVCGSHGISSLGGEHLSCILKMITSHPCASAGACRGPQTHSNNAVTNSLLIFYFDFLKESLKIF